MKLSWIAPGSSEPLLSMLAGWAGRCSAFGLRAVTGASWRMLAACGGVLGAGWLASTVPSLLEAPAEAHVPALHAASITGTLADAPRITPEWVQVPRPVASFGLGLADIDGQPARLQARRDTASTAREDQMIAGSFAGQNPHFVLVLRRSHAAPAGSLFVALTRQAAENGLAIERTAQPVPLASKFGALESADIVLGDGDKARTCLAFRHLADEAAFAFQGWLCAGAGRTVDRQQITCLIDRIHLMAAGDDRPLRAHFSKAELQRQPACVSSKLQAAGRKTNWLDADQPAPALRRSTPERVAAHRPAR
ncbi:MAG: hypothetical protein ACOVN4_07415 [Bosea sp. (in: a-proteobacteria)]